MLWLSTALLPVLIGCIFFLVVLLLLLAVPLDGGCGNIGVTFTVWVIYTARAIFMFLKATFLQRVCTHGLVCKHHISSHSLTPRCLILR